MHPSQLLPWWSTLQLPCCAIEEIVMPTVNGGASAISRSITEIWLSMHRLKTGWASTLAGALPAISCNALHISTAPTRHTRTSANFIVKLKGHGHGSESPHIYAKLGWYSSRGGIPISAARASVGGVWPRAKYTVSGHYSRWGEVLCNFFIITRAEKWSRLKPGAQR